MLEFGLYYNILEFGFPIFHGGPVRKSQHLLFYFKAYPMKGKYDILWKGMLERVFDDFLRFVFPNADRRKPHIMAAVFDG